MKTPPRFSFVYFFWGAMLIICSCVPESSSLRSPDKTADQEAIFFVQGMTCSSCEWLVKVELEEHPGISEVKVKLGSPESEVKVSFNSAKIEPQKIIQTIDNNKKFKTVRYTQKSINI